MGRREYRKDGETAQEAKKRFWEEYDPDGHFREIFRENSPDPDEFREMIQPEEPTDDPD